MGPSLEPPCIQKWSDPLPRLGPPLTEAETTVKPAGRLAKGMAAPPSMEMQDPVKMNRSVPVLGVSISHPGP